MWNRTPIGRFGASPPDGCVRLPERGAILWRSQDMRPSLSFAAFDAKPDSPLVRRRLDAMLLQLHAFRQTGDRCRRQLWPTARCVHDTARSMHDQCTVQHDHGSLASTYRVWGPLPTLATMPAATSSLRSFTAWRFLTPVTSW